MTFLTVTFVILSATYLIIAGIYPNSDAYKFIHDRFTKESSYLLYILTLQLKKICYGRLLYRISIRCNTWLTRFRCCAMLGTLDTVIIANTLEKTEDRFI